MLVEPVSGPKPYPLRTAADVVAVLDRVRAAGAANVGFLCDLYHLAINGDDLDAAIDRYADRVAHVQIADAPGRGEPGTGALDLDGHLDALDAKGYDGWVGAGVQAHGHHASSLLAAARSARLPPRQRRRRATACHEERAA